MRSSATAGANGRMDITRLALGTSTQLVADEIDEAIVEEDTLAVARRAQESDQSVVLFERVFSLSAIAEEGCTTMGLGQSNFASVIELLGT